MPPEEEILPLAVESVEITRRRVPRAEVRVRVAPETHREDIDVTLQDTDVAVERVPVGRFVDSMPQVRTEGDVTIIPVIEERAVVTVRLFLREEVRLRTDRRSRVERHAVILRAERAEVERRDLNEGELDT